MGSLLSFPETKCYTEERRSIPRHGVIEGIGALLIVDDACSMIPSLRMFGAVVKAPAPGFKGLKDKDFLLHLKDKKRKFLVPLVAGKSLNP